MSRTDVPTDVAAIRSELEQLLNKKDRQGRIVGNARHGVYAFYDYDGEPIYVGQTMERLRVRIRRHLTNQRTDAVAMNVLDPFEVAEVEMWPFFDLAPNGGKLTAKEKARLGAAEYTVYEQVLRASTFRAVLNEKEIPRTRLIRLPSSLRGRIVPNEIYEVRKHPDVRIARRATTIAALARVISERAVSPGLRRTLVTQARRLEHLAALRFEGIGGDTVVEMEAEADAD